MKICNRCGVVYENIEDNFSKNKKGKDGFLNICKFCSREYSKKYYHKNKEKIIKYGKMYYRDNKERAKEYYQKNRAYFITKTKEFFARNPDYEKEYAKKWRDRHNGGYTEKAKKYKKEYYKNKRDNDASYRRANVLRSTLWSIFKRNSCSEKTLSILGVRSKEEFKEYIYNQFSPGMTPENYGMKGWSLDHKKPVIDFDLTKEDQVKECFHHTNLRPMWFKDNCGRRNV